MPLVSVIIPTCNGVNRYVNESIASVLAQTFQDFELIIIDDASTDGTLEYVQGLIPAHHKVIYYQRETNGGPSAARNDGAKRAKGEFLAFLDQDDLWEPTLLEETAAVLQTTSGCMVVRTDGYILNEQDEMLRYDAAMTTTNNLPILLQKDSKMLVTTGTLIRKTVFDAVGGFDERLRIGEDADLGIRIGQQNYHVTPLPKQLYRHRVWRHSACSNTDPHKAFASRTYFLEKYAPICQNDPHLQQVLQYEWAQLYSNMGKYAESQRQKKQAREWYRQSLRIRPFSRRIWLRYLRSFVPFCRQ